MAIYGAQPMLPLPEEMARRQSEQAGMLQSAQAQMGGLGQAPPEGGMSPGASGAQGQTFSGLMQQRRAQAEQLQARQSDLQVGERMMQILDPRLPRPARQFLFRELSRQIGIDPKGEQAKEIGAMVTALDPQTLEGLRRSMASRLQGAQPGEITQLARGVLTGQVPITELISPASDASPGDGTVNITGAGAQGGGAAPAPAASASAPAMGGGPGALTSGSAPFPGRMSLGAGSIASGLDQVGAEGSPVTPVQAPGVPGQSVGPRGGPPLRLPFQAAPPETPSRPAESAIPPLQREVAPELAEILGLDSTQRLRNIDVIRGAGFRRIPTEYDAQRRMALDLRAMQDGVVSSLLSGNALYELIEGRPDALNLSLGRIPWIGEVTLPNPASTRVQIRDFLNSIGRSMGLEEVRSAEGDTETPGRVMQLSRDLAERFGSLLTRQLRVEGSDPAALQESATTNARIQSLLINLAFSMAAAQGQTGRNLSDRDLELQLLALGRSANPEQFQAAIRTTMQRIYGQYLDRSQAQVGGNAPLGHAIPSEFLNTMIQGPVTPPHLIEQLTGRRFVEPGAARGDISRLMDVDRPGSAAGGSYSPQDTRPPGTFTGQHTFVPYTETIEGTRAESLAGEQRYPHEAVPLSRTTVTRQTPTLETEEASARQRAEEDRAGVLAARAADARRLEIAESQEARAARTEVRTVEEQRRQRIRDAFAQVAAAFRSGSSNSGISVGSANAAGGDQDAAAFRIQPGPQRRPPEPIDASRFRRT